MSTKASATRTRAARPTRRAGRAAHGRSRSDASGGRLLPWIAAERTVRGLLLVAVGVVLVADARADWGHVIRSVARAIGFDPSRNGIRRLTAEARSLSPRQLVLYGIAGIGYGVLECVEGYGLFRRRRWAEYLTVIVTSLLFAPEIWELVKKTTPLKIAALVVNVLIVAYLLHRLLRGRRGDSG